jgi:deoxyribodipyrimidine photo-lyase
MKALLWFRRCLRLKDNKVIHEALKNGSILEFIFIFDSEVLRNFPNKQDRRLSFIVEHLDGINSELKKYGGKLHILYGDPKKIIPEFAIQNQIDEIYTEEDYEPYAINRDNFISDKIKLNLVLDHLLIHPSKILKSDGSPFKVFTPYMKEVRKELILNPPINYKYDLKGKVALYDSYEFDKKEILEKAGYIYQKDEIWHPDFAQNLFAKFYEEKFENYHDNRNILFGDHTSRISPYLRFGALSIREIYNKSIIIEKFPNYVNELIWREFYAYIMFHFPNSIENEFQEKYIGKIKWNYDDKKLEAFYNGMTGFPVVDAAIRELRQTGWMHNRARMIVASFLTKNMFMDWRIGEKFFAQYLMDYELSSNVGGWQWTASTGTDAQPYFRVFNPINQGKDYDKDGSYIKKYVPELAKVSVEHIHDPEIIHSKYRVDYPRPIIDYKSSREFAISSFKEIS